MRFIGLEDADVITRDVAAPLLREQVERDTYPSCQYQRQAVQAGPGRSTDRRRAATYAAQLDVAASAPAGSRIIGAKEASACGKHDNGGPPERELLSCRAVAPDAAVSMVGKYSSRCCSRCNRLRPMSIQRGVLPVRVTASDSSLIVPLSR